MTTEDKFQAAVNIIRSLPKDGPYQPSHDMMLKFYGLYKQAVEGPCTEPKPAFYEVVKGYKWHAWHSLGSMSKAEAKNCYVDELKKIIETMSYTENVANFIDMLGPFYEYVDIPGKKKLNNNTSKGPPSSGDLTDSGNEVTDSSSGSRNSSPVPNGVHCEGRLERDVPLPALPPPTPSQNLQSNEEVSQEEEVEGEEEEEEEEDLQVGGPGNQVPGAAAAAVVAAHKVFSDSDSDEEYSEPAESPTLLSPEPQPSTPILLYNHHHIHLSSSSSTSSTTSTTSTTTTTAQQLNANNTDQEDPSTPHNHPKPQELQDSAVTHGGGDKSHPGGLQMTPGQSMQGRSTLPLAFSSPSHHTHSLWGVGGGAGGAGRGGGGRGGGGGGRGGSTVEEDVSAQLVVVLHRLQTDMESVLHRLNTLETLTLTQHHVLCRQCQGNSSSSSTTTPNSSGHSWWPFPELSPRSTFFLLVWPVFLHLGLKLLPLIRCRRKRS